MPIDTAKIRFRTLHFATPDHALAEAERLADAARRGQLTTLGNWTPGQVFGHLAWWIDTIDNPGKAPPPPWFVKLLGPLIKRKIVNGPPKAGFKIPGAPTGTHGDRAVDLETGLASLRAGMERLKRGNFPPRSPVFGTMSEQDWLGLHLRHAELHLGFLEVRG